MSADLLREAAAKIRGDNLTGKDRWVAVETWLTVEVNGCNCDFGGEIPHRPECGLEPLQDMGNADLAEHVAATHNALPAIVDWLDAEAHNAEVGIRGQGFHSIGGQSDAVAVARAYLGRPA